MLTINIKVWNNTARADWDQEILSEKGAKKSVRAWLFLVEKIIISKTDNRKAFCSQADCFGAASLPPH